ncbi:unnamed protein product [Closterium sp. NIES-54]
MTHDIYIHFRVTHTERMSQTSASPCDPMFSTRRHPRSPTSLAPALVTRACPRFRASLSHTFPFVIRVSLRHARFP